MENQFSLKELYDVKIKTTYPIEINGKQLEIGETIAMFDRIKIANFEEVKNFIAAKGGYNNEGRVFWEDEKEIRINFQQGIFNTSQFSLMNNAKLLENKDSGLLTISKREMNQSNGEGNIFLEETPLGNIFIYDENGNKLSYSQEENRLKIDETYCRVIVDYEYKYKGNSQSILVGRPLIQGFLSLEGKTRVKEDITGQVKTGIIKIPKLRLMSELSMRLGQDAVPVMGSMTISGLPSGVKGSKKVMELTILEEDIDSDI